MASDPRQPMSIPGTSFPGAKDARPFEQQSEVRTWTTEPLREPVEWTTILPNGEAMIEIIRPPRTVVIFGSGADAEPVAQLAGSAGWVVTVPKPREIFDARGFDAAVVMTHNFARDAEILARLFASPIQYIGLLGPRSPRSRPRAAPR